MAGRVALSSSTPPARASRSAAAAAFVLVGGLPGAGKTTALQELAAGAAAVIVLDPEQHRRRLSELLPPRLHYRWYRAAVHALHTLTVVAALLAGPARGGGRGLAVHDPATRPLRRAATARLARWRGWAPILVLLDVDVTTALAGQRARGRVLGVGAFSRHRRRWDAQRPGFASGTADGAWEHVHLVGRPEAAAVLRRLLS